MIPAKIYSSEFCRYIPSNSLNYPIAVHKTIGKLIPKANMTKQMGITNLIK